MYCRVTEQNTLLIYDIKRTLQLETDSSSVEHNQKKRWFHWIIRNVYNPPSYAPDKQFTLSYFDAESHQKTLWHLEKSLQYFISEAAREMSITDIVVSNLNWHTQSDYEFSLYSDNHFDNYFLLTHLAILIKFPSQQYDNRVQLFQELIQPNCATEYGFVQKQWSPCHVYGKELLIENVFFDTPKQQNSFKVNLKNIINPKPNTQCSNPSSNTVEPYQVIFLDTIANEYLIASTPLKNKKNCVKFGGDLYKIEVQGSNILNPGLSVVLKIKIEQPAHGLVLEPKTQDSVKQYLTFTPPLLQFNDFEKTEQSLTVSVSSEAPDVENTSIYFQKTEDKALQSNDFYLPLLPFQIKIAKLTSSSASSSSSATITVANVETDTTGYPITVPVSVSEPPSYLIYLQLKLVGTDENSAVQLKQTRIPIDINTKNTQFELLVNSTRVPPTLQLHMSISSYYPQNHKLIPEIKYLLFSIGSKGFLHVSILNVDTFYQQDKDKLIPGFQPQLQFSTQANVTELIPKIIQSSAVKSEANNVYINIDTTRKANLFYMVKLAGSEAPTSEQVLEQKLINEIIQKGKEQTIIEYNKGNIHLGSHVYQLKVQNLHPQTAYTMYVIASNAMGNSELNTYLFKTGRGSFGNLVQIPLREFIDPPTIIPQIIKALSNTLRIQQSRLLSVTTVADLEKKKKEYVPDVMDSPNYLAEIVILPNATNDSPTPTEYAEKLKTTAYLYYFEKNFPSLDTARKILTQQVQKTTPSIFIEPYTAKITHYNATIELTLWEPARIFAICRKKVEGAQPMFTSQIYKGTDDKNQKLNNYKIATAKVQNGEKAILSFDDLMDNTSYEVFITAACVLHYDDPPQLYEDQQIRKIEFKTPVNPNLLFNEISVLRNQKDVNPDLVRALEKIITRKENEIPVENTVRLSMRGKDKNQQQQQSKN